MVELIVATVKSFSSLFKISNARTAPHSIFTLTFSISIEFLFFFFFFSFKLCHTFHCSHFHNFVHKFNQLLEMNNVFVIKVGWHLVTLERWVIYIWNWDFSQMAHGEFCHFYIRHFVFISIHHESLFCYRRKNGFKFSFCWWKIKKYLLLIIFDP